LPDQLLVDHPRAGLFPQGLDSENHASGISDDAFLNHQILANLSSFSMITVLTPWPFSSGRQAFLPKKAYLRSFLKSLLSVDSFNARLWALAKSTIAFLGAQIHPHLLPFPLTRTYPKHLIFSIFYHPDITINYKISILVNIFIYFSEDLK